MCAIAQSSAGLLRVQSFDDSSRPRIIVEVFEKLPEGLWFVGQVSAQEA
jgi:hypothetical protein